jgi:tetratricopeptide (TPR) repeat protein
VRGSAKKFLSSHPKKEPDVEYPLKELNDALLIAFNKSELEQMVRIQLNMHLEHISIATDLTAIVFALTEKAAREDWIRALVLGAHEANPGNRKLSDLAAKVNNFAPLRTPPTLFHVRYDRNPNFTGREEVLTSLRENLIAEGAAGLTQAITGTGGIGKTQTANEYCYRHKGNYRYVLWVNATDTATLDADFRQLATKLALPVREAQEAETVREGMKEWLRNTHDWLLVFDNADTPTLLEAYRPVGADGHILITTRDKRLRTFGITAPVVLDVWSREEAEAFFVHSQLLDLEKPDEHRDAATVAAELGYLPLALEQAAAYILNVGVTFSEYLAAFRARRLKLFEKEEAKPTQYEKTVAVTWQMTIAQIEQESEAAAELLRHCAFLAPDNIPWDIFRYGAPHLGALLAEALDEVDLDISPLKELLAHCTRYSMLTYTEDGMAVNIHRLLQEVIRIEMEQEKQRIYVKRVTAALTASWQGGDYAYWPYLDMLLPHQKACTENIKKYGIVTAETATLFAQVGYHLHSQAQYRETEPFYIEALEIRRQALPQRHSEIATSLNNLAGLYNNQGQYEKAEPLYEEAIEIERSIFPEGHLAIAISLNNLGHLYQKQGQYERAEPLFKEALDIKRQFSPKDHPSIATSLNNIAELYRVQSRYVEAEPLYLEALERWRLLLPTDHPSIATCLNNLSLLYVSQMRYTEAESFFIEALERRRVALPPVHPDIATSLNNLAMLYYHQSRYVEAETFYVKALEIQYAVLPEGHPEIAQSLNNLAELYRVQKHYAKAEGLYIQTLEIRRQALPGSHSDIALSLNNLGRLYFDQGRYAEAEILLIESLAIFEQSLPSFHPHIVNACTGLTAIYTKMGQMEKSREFAEKAQTIREAHERVSHCECNR